MRIVIARCSVSYEGRGRTELPEAIRMIILKRDGSVSVHSDDRAYKPLNWMLPPCLVEISIAPNSTNKWDPIEIWTVRNKKESLEIQIYEIISDNTHLLEEADPGLIRSWTEKHLQAWIAEHVIEVFGQGWTLVGREHPTGAGPVDLLVRDPEGVPVAVEVKRTGQMGAVDQVCRYVEALQNYEGWEDTRGIVLALNIRPRALKLAQDRGIVAIEISAHLYR
jgi:hypothetical protein